MTTQQGDITRIEDVNGNVLATYEYDAWGNLISSSGSLADINPLRYRGYYYDTEAGFYYLQSRYYDPVVSRFINTDRYASTGTGLLSYNMFAYCQNSPVNYSDPQGTMQLVANDGRPGLIGGALSGIKIGLDAVNQATLSPSRRD
jgi:RHS repeat-associated protein